MRFPRLLVLALMLAVPAATAAPAAASTPYRGVQLHSLWWESSNDDMDRELDLARKAGATTVRVDVAWGSLEESGKGQFTPWYVDKLDRFVAGADSRGMKVLVTLWATPCWASSAPDTQKQGCASGWWSRDVVQYPPVRTADYADIAQWVTSRYGSKLAALEVWNEPNLSQFWRGPDPARAYADLLRAAYPAARAGDDSVPVLAGALSDSDRTFLADLFDAGIKGYYDGLADHAYADSGFDKLKAFREEQRSHGDDSPIWVTEFGWPTGDDPQWHVTEAVQATKIAGAFADLAAIDWVKGAILYNLRDKGTDDSDMEDNFGVVSRDYTPKPAYDALTAALKDVTAELPPVTTTPVTTDPLPPVTDPTVTDPTTTDPTGTDPTGTDPPTTSDPESDEDESVSVTRDLRKKTLYVAVKGPANATVHVDVSGCKSSKAKPFDTELPSSGDTAVKLGKAKAWVGCDFEGQVSG